MTWTKVLYVTCQFQVTVISVDCALGFHGEVVVQTLATVGLSEETCYIGAVLCMHTSVVVPVHSPDNQWEAPTKNVPALLFKHGP